MKQKEAKSKMVFKGAYLSDEDLNRLKNVRRRLLREDAVAAHSHIISAGIYALQEMKPSQILELLKKVINERDKLNLRHQEIWESPESELEQEE